MVGLPSSFDYQTDWPLLTAQSADTALFILRELGRVGYLYQEEEPSCVPRKPTLKGYERLQQIQSTGRNPKQDLSQCPFPVNKCRLNRLIEAAV